MTLALEARAKADDIIIGDTPKAKRRRKRLADLTPVGRLWKQSTLRDIDGIVDASTIPSISRRVLCFHNRPTGVRSAKRLRRLLALGVSPIIMSSALARASSASVMDVPPVFGA